MKKTIFELGSVNQDVSIEASIFPKNGETVNGGGLKLALGGKGANQAVAIHRGGAEVAFLAKVGNDPFGADARKTLASYGLKTQCIHVNENSSTGTAIIILHNGDNRIILSHGANYSISKEEVDEFLSQAKPGDIFLSQYENEPQLTSYAFSEAKKRGLFTVWNPSPIGNFGKDLLKNIDLLVVNEKEMEAILEIAGAKKPSELPVASILLTLGDKGSRYYGEEAEFSISAEKITPVDTTGAGDTYLGFFLSGLANGKSIPDCLEIATKASALACLKRGASESIPLLSECL